MKVLYEDKHVIAVEKPVGVMAEGAEDTGADNVVSLLLARERENGKPTPYIAPVHRLDCAVGGVMVLAKKQYAAALLSEVVRERGAKKEYLACVWGTFPEKSGTMTDLLYKDARKNKVFVVDRMRAGVKEASLSYAVLGEAEADGKPVSLLKITLGTGRSHQIRVQLANRSHPILCDGKYGGQRPEGARGAGIALWSHHMQMPHPVTLSRSADGRKPNPNAPAFADLDVYSCPPKDDCPWSLFARQIAETVNNT